MTEIIAYNPFIKQLRSDKGYRVEFDVSESDYDNIKDLPKLQDVILKVRVEVKGKNNLS